MRNNVVGKRIVAAIAVAVLLVIVVTGIFRVSPASAAKATPSPNSAGVQGNPTWLAFQLKREQIALSAQQDRLTRMGDVAVAVQSLINSAKAEGKDPSGLQSALDAFHQQIQSAQIPHSSAKSILDAKAGFDSNGQVADATEARQTLKSAAQSMRDAHQIIGPATKALRWSFRAFIQANRPTKGIDQSTGGGA
jgi:hypothetical protein